MTDVAPPVQTINALRGHLVEYGVIMAKGTAYVAELVQRAMDPKTDVPEAARFVLEILIKTMVTLEMQIKKLDSEITRRARKEKDARRLMTIPGVGPMTATALLALASAAGSFRCGRDFAAWLGLTPLQRSTGGKQKLGATSKMGERTLRRLLIMGATAVVQQARRRRRFTVIVARAHDCPQATYAGSHRSCQQDGPRRLGFDGQRWGL
ncbi:transposase [Bradyrhizobium sp. USDA 4501]